MKHQHSEAEPKPQATTPAVSSPETASSLKESRERIIRYAVREFETALRIMMRDSTTTHWFDLGTGTKDGQAEMWSVQITIAPKRLFEQIQRTLGMTVTSSEPIELIREEKASGEKPQGVAPDSSNKQNQR